MRSFARLVLVAAVAFSAACSKDGGERRGSGVEAEPNDGFAEANDADVIARAGAIAGEITPGDVDVFQVTVPAVEPGVLRITTFDAGGEACAGVDTVVVLLDADLREVARSDDDGPGLCSRLERAPGPGRYYLRVTGYRSTDAFRYVLRVDRSDAGTEREPNGGLADANALPARATPVRVTAAIDDAGDVDLYRLDLLADATIRATLTDKDGAGCEATPPLELSLLSTAQTVLQPSSPATPGACRSLVFEASPGTYLVAVRALSGAPTGYALEVTAVAHVEVEPNGTLAQANPLALLAPQGMVSGRIFPGDVDLFQLIVPAGPPMALLAERVVIDGFACVGDGRLELLDAAGRALAVVEDCLTLQTIVPAGLYYLRLSGPPGESFPYRLHHVLTTVNLDEVEPNDTPGGANTLLNGAVATAFVGAGDVDLWRVVVTSGDAVQVIALVNDTADLCGIPGDVRLDLLDAAGQELGRREGAGCFALPALLGAGTYYVRVSAGAQSPSAAFGYRLRRVDVSAQAPTEIEPNGTPGTASAVPAGVSEIGAGRIDPAGDVDLWRLEVPEAAGASVAVAATDPSGSCYQPAHLELLDGAGTVLAATGPAGEACAGLSRFLPTGTYFLRFTAAAVDPTGRLAYRFTVGRGTPSFTELEPNGTLAAAADFSAQSSGGLATAALAPAGDVDLYRVAMPSAGVLLARTRSLDGGCFAISTTLSVLGAGGDPIASSSPIDGPCAAVRVTAPAGAYHLRVAAGPLADGFAYQLLVSTFFPIFAVESEPNDDGAVAVGQSDFSAAAADGPYQADAQLAGAIQPAGDEDVYAVVNPTDAPVRVSLDTFTDPDAGGCTADTLVTVLDAAGVALAVDDDSGPALCSSLAYVIPATTTVYVSVSDFGDNGEIPAYTLLVDFP